MAKILPTLLLGSLSGGAVFLGLNGTFSDDPILLQRISELEEQVSTKEIQLGFLRERRRVASIEVLEQRQDPGRPGGQVTRFRFQELDPGGKPYNDGDWYEIDGDLLYIEALVIKFDDTFVENNDLLRGSSLLLFRRLFGEHQNPADGFAIDSVGQFPRAYSPEEGAPPFHRDLWKNFWDYALNPETVRESGVRAMHGEAPFIKLAPGGKYQVELRTSGGLTIRTQAD
ncbi:MAG: hypothetical protein O3A95_09830 [Planctomycetota bacterium]|nr:hypothetical protein [Planctomycetota bacterium]MDA1114581.1 hypothetical protein [Planctomycetota bacterium]